MAYLVPSFALLTSALLRVSQPRGIFRNNLKQWNLGTHHRKQPNVLEASGDAKFHFSLVGRRGLTGNWRSDQDGAVSGGTHRA